MMQLDIETSVPKLAVLRGHCLKVYSPTQTIAITSTGIHWADLCLYSLELTHGFQFKLLLLLLFLIF